ncbi:MAG: hypothetical protein R3C15_21475 [Thermoleophilia bacterium]
MRIQASDVTLASTQLATQYHGVRDSVRAWKGDEPDRAGRRDGAERAGHHHHRHRGGLEDVILELSKAAQDALDALAAGQADAASEVASETADPKLRVVQLILERLTGRKIDLLSAEDMKPAADAAAAQAAVAAQGRRGDPGWGAVARHQEVRYSYEQTTFEAQGTVRTADGKEIDFSLSLQMTREELTVSDSEVRLGNAVRPKDPLVVNFDGTAAQLTDVRFQFDLDANGAADEQMAFTTPGSGFLVFDRNGNGAVDDGSELFGPQTGDGFAELAALDDDGNGWVDEGDAAWDKLGVWTKDAGGVDAFQTLRAAGVGALFTGRVGTGFGLTGADGQLDGLVRSSGVYLNENGTAGLLQQVDLVA